MLERTTCALSGVPVYVSFSMMTVHGTSVSDSHRVESVSCIYVLSLFLHARGHRLARLALFRYLSALANVSPALCTYTVSPSLAHLSLALYARAHHTEGELIFAHVL